METKAEIRRRLLFLRESMGKEEVAAKSRLIGCRLWESGLLSGVSRIGLYSSIRNEVETRDLFFRLREMGKRLFFPFLRRGAIFFSNVGDLTKMKAGRFGILEPEEIIPISLQELELVVVPGVAFDESGLRLGFGNGFYDRAFHRFCGLTVGLAYDFQVVSKIPETERDLRCGTVVTEDRFLQWRRS